MDGQNKNNKTKIDESFKDEINKGHFKKMTLKGIVSKERFSGLKKIGRYYLTCKNGERFQFFTTKEWDDVLDKLCWIDVKVVGVVELENQIIIPTAIIPYFPTESRAPIEATFRERTSKLIGRIKNFDYPIFQQEIAIA